jgi:hypothetical protein
MTDIDNNASGYSLSSDAAWSGSTGAGTWASADHEGYDQLVWEGCWFGAVAVNRTLTIGNLTNGDSYDIDVACYANRSDRPTTISVDSGTGVEIPNQLADPDANAIANFTGTVSGTTVTLEFSGSSNFYYLNFIDATFTASGPTITSVSSDNTIQAGEQDAAVVGTALDTVTTATANGVNVFSGFTDTSAVAATQDFTALPTSNVVSHEGPVTFDYIIGDGSNTDTQSIDGSATLTNHVAWMTYTAAPTNADTQIGAGLSLTGGDSVTTSDVATFETTPATNVTFAFSGTTGGFSLSGSGYDADTTYTVDGYLWDAIRS